METSFYYTFSTIAQVLAGFLALSGVFVIYQIQKYTNKQTAYPHFFHDSMLKKYCNEGTVFISLNELKSVIDSGNYSESLNYLRTIVLDENLEQKYPSYHSNAKGTLKLIRTIEVDKKILLLLTKISLVIGVIVILFSLLILANVNYIYINLSEYAFWFFTIGITGAFLCLATMSAAIILSLNNQEFNITKKELWSKVRQKIGFKVPKY